MKNSKIKLIIVDLYGVISKGSYREVCEWIADKYGYDFEYVYDVVYHKHFTDAANGKITEKESFEYAVNDLDLNETWEEIREKHLESQELNKQAYEYFKQKEKQGFTVVLLSKNTKYQFQDTLDILDIRGEFAEIINTLDLGLPKASSKTLNYVLQRYQTKPKQAVIIDDQDFNLPEAEKMGIKTILYKDFSQMKSELEKIL